MVFCKILIVILKSVKKSLGIRYKINSLKFDIYTLNTTHILFLVINLRNFEIKTNNRKINVLHAVTMRMHLLPYFNPFLITLQVLFIFTRDAEIC